MVADLLSPNRCHWYIAKVKNYNLNVTEVLVSDFKNAFPGIFNFTVGILVTRLRQVTLRRDKLKPKKFKVIFQNQNLNLLT